MTFKITNSGQSNMDESYHFYSQNKNKHCGNPRKENLTVKKFTNPLQSLMFPPDQGSDHFQLLVPGAHFGLNCCGDPRVLAGKGSCLVAYQPVHAGELPFTDMTFHDLVRVLQCHVPSESILGIKVSSKTKWAI